MKRRSVTLKLLGVVLSAALLVGAMGTFHQTSAAPAKHVKIGSVMPITGPLAVLGLAFNRGWQLYLDKINSQGGLKIGDEAYVSISYLKTVNSLPKAQVPPRRSLSTRTKSITLWAGSWNSSWRPSIK